jgi:hypothetical protein
MLWHPGVPRNVWVRRTLEARHFEPRVFDRPAIAMTPAADSRPSRVQLPPGNTREHGWSFGARFGHLITLGGFGRLHEPLSAPDADLIEQAHGHRERQL